MTSPSSSSSTRSIVLRDGKPIAILRRCNRAVLPFDLETCVVETVTGDPAPRVECAASTWSIKIKVVVALDRTSATHWIYFSNPQCDAAKDYSVAFDGTEDGLVQLARKLFSDKPSLSQAGAETWRLYVASEPNEECAISATPALLSKCTVDTGWSHERVMLANSDEEVLRMLGHFLEDYFICGETAPTVVCWPPDLTFPVNVHSRDPALRREEHDSLALPRLPLLNYWQRIVLWQSAADLQRPAARHIERTGGKSWERHLARNPHEAITRGPSPVIAKAQTHLASGSYDYYHYRIDGCKDDGWGCAYRSLQTILSWFQYEGIVSTPMPTLKEIQGILLTVDPEKQNRSGFVGSRDWIGSYEIMMVLQHYIPDLECTIRRLEHGSDLDTDPAVQGLILEHFTTPWAPPIMIGGSSYAHTIAGVHINPDTMEAQYLIIDPHYPANPTNLKTAVSKGFISWKTASKFFESSSWYNLCIPRMDTYDPR